MELVVFFFSFGRSPSFILQIAFKSCVSNAGSGEAV